MVAPANTARLCQRFLGGEQWFCCPGGKPLDPKLPQAERDDHILEWGLLPKGHDDVRLKMSEDVKRALDTASGSANAIGSPAQLTKNMLKPDWVNQIVRVVVPCVGTNRFHWVRIGPVVSLGQLFLILGKLFSAAQIFHFYRTLRVVALKKRKTASKGIPGQALPATGSLVAGIAGTSVKKSPLASLPSKFHQNNDFVVENCMICLLFRSAVIGSLGWALGD